MHSVPTRRARDKAHFPTVHTKREGTMYSVPTRRARDRAHFPTVHTRRKVPCTLFLHGAHATRRIFPLHVHTKREGAMYSVPTRRARDKAHVSPVRALLAC